ncbi:hypothetical protein [Noviherbaspirillum humi]|uniref:hypothetical protein n=1 Tax=Noviherbaspirillum humi TaxID=1688639 RepID=UPI000B78C5D1|nr:hypothetical protein [Noviherbaspirillum humi]
MGIASLLGKLRNDGVTPVTVARSDDVTAEARPELAVTLETAVTAQISIATNSDEAAVSLVSIDSLLSLKFSEKAEIQAWLDHIGESDPLIVSAVFSVAAANVPEKIRLLAYIKEQNTERYTFGDRRYCDECANLLANGKCLAAQRRQLLTSSSLTPILDIRHRCGAFEARQLNGPGRNLEKDDNYE